MALHNKYDKETLRKKLASEPFQRKTVSFYRYVIIEDPASLRDELYRLWENMGVLGRVYIAREGINAQICIPEPQVESFKADLYARPEFKDIPFKWAVEDDGKSFLKLIVRVKEK